MRHHNMVQAGSKLSRAYLSDRRGGMGSTLPLLLAAWVKLVGFHV